MKGRAVGGAHHGCHALTDLKGAARPLRRHGLRPPAARASARPGRPPCCSTSALLPTHSAAHDGSSCSWRQRSAHGTPMQRQPVQSSPVQSRPGPGQVARLRAGSALHPAHLGLSSLDLYSRRSTSSSSRGFTSLLNASITLHPTRAPGPAQRGHAGEAGAEGGGGGGAAQVDCVRLGRAVPPAVGFFPHCIDCEGKPGLVPRSSPSWQPPPQEPQLIKPASQRAARLRAKMFAPSPPFAASAARLSAPVLA